MSYVLVRWANQPYHSYRAGEHNDWKAAVSTTHGEAGRDVPPGAGPRFGRLLRVAAKSGWAHEGLDFTPWLAENLDRLGEAVGLALELRDRAHPVGKYWLDLPTVSPVEWTWAKHAQELGISQERIAVGRALVGRLEEAIAAHGLPWQPRFRKGYVAFQRASGYNVVLVDLWWRRAPRLAIKVPDRPRAAPRALNPDEQQSLPTPEHHERTSDQPAAGTRPPASARIRSMTSSNPSPAASAASGSRLVSVRPGIVFASST